MINNSALRFVKLNVCHDMSKELNNHNIYSQPTFYDVELEQRITAVANGESQSARLFQLVTEESDEKILSRTIPIFRKVF